MADIVTKMGNALQYMGIVLLVGAIFLLGFVAWEHEQRLPDEIPPHWFEEDVNEIRDNVRALEIKVERLEHDVR